VPLAKELSWYLPFAFFPIILFFVTMIRKKILDNAAKIQLLVWGLWLMIGFVLFSFASFFHNYYLVH
jgi:4-amino-4-deoxy-L-arabinose transferase-like glycosyltransferase